MWKVGKNCDRWKLFEYADLSKGMMGKGCLIASRWGRCPAIYKAVLFGAISIGHPQLRSSSSCAWLLNSKNIYIGHVLGERERLNKLDLSDRWWCLLWNLSFQHNQIPHHLNGRRLMNPTCSSNSFGCHGPTEKRPWSIFNRLHNILWATLPKRV